MIQKCNENELVRGSIIPIGLVVDTAAKERGIGSKCPSETGGMSNRYSNLAPAAEVNRAVVKRSGS
jgi:hypothetical protein